MICSHYFPHLNMLSFTLCVYTCRNKLNDFDLGDYKESSEEQEVVRDDDASNSPSQEAIVLSSTAELSSASWRRPRSVNPVWPRQVQRSHVPENIREDVESGNLFNSHQLAPGTFNDSQIGQSTDFAEDCSEIFDGNHDLFYTPRRQYRSKLESSFEDYLDLVIEDFFTH